MLDDRTPSAEPYLGGDAVPLPWSRALEELAGARTFWLASVHPHDRPHLAPVLGVVAGGALHVAANDASRKVRNLARNPEVVASTHGDALDLVIEGTVSHLDQDASLEEVARAYATTYGWQVEVRGGALHGQGAPTAGPPPYHVHRIEPRCAFGFPIDGVLTPTRWVFPE